MTEQGTGYDRYVVIPRTLIFIFNGDDVLLIKGSANKKIWAGKYNGVGGHVEMGEDILTSAKRELFEETGINYPNLDYCGQIQVDPGSSPGVAVHIFRGEVGNISLTSGHEGNLEWIPINDIANFTLVKDLYQILPAVHKWRLGKPFIFGKTSYKSGEMVVELTGTSLRS